MKSKSPTRAKEAPSFPVSKKNQLQSMRNLNLLVPDQSNSDVKVSEDLKLLKEVVNKASKRIP